MFVLHFCAKTFVKFFMDLCQGGKIGDPGEKSERLQQNSAHGKQKPPELLLGRQKSAKLS